MIGNDFDLKREKKNDFVEREYSIAESDHFMTQFPQKFEQFLNPETTNLVIEEMIHFIPLHLNLLNEDNITHMLQLFIDDDISEQKALVLSNISLLFYYILKEKNDSAETIRNYLISSEFYKILYPTLFPYFNTPLVLMRLLHNNAEIAIYLLQNNILNNVLAALSSDVDYSSIFMLLSALSSFELPESDVFKDFVHNMANLVFQSKNDSFMSQGITCLYCFIELCPEEAPYLIDLCTHIQKHAFDSEAIFKSIMYLISSSIQFIENPSQLQFCHELVLHSINCSDENIKIKGFDAILNGPKEFVQLFVDDSYLTLLFEMISDQTEYSSAIVAKGISVICAIFLICPPNLQEEIIARGIVEQVCNNLELLNQLALAQPLYFLHACVNEESLKDTVIDILHDTDAIDTLQNISQNEDEDGTNKEIAEQIIHIIDDSNQL